MQRTVGRTSSELKAKARAVLQPPKRLRDLHKEYEMACGMYIRCWFLLQPTLSFTLFLHVMRCCACDTCHYTSNTNLCTFVVLGNLNDADDSQNEYFTTMMRESGHASDADLHSKCFFTLQVKDYSRSAWILELHTWCQMLHEMHQYHIWMHLGCGYTCLSMQVLWLDTPDGNSAVTTTCLIR